MVRTHGRSRAARRDLTPSGGVDPEIAFDPDSISARSRSEIEKGMPWTLEIGTGNGVFLADEAGRHPGSSYLGVERDAEFFYKMKRRIVRDGLKNVRCIRAEIEPLLEVLLPKRSVGSVILNFSDPWPKRRHRDRRVFRPSFLTLLEPVLLPGSTLRFKTDIGWYFNLAVNDLRRQPGWKLEAAGPADRISSEGDPSGAPKIETNFERKGREQGRQIWAFTSRWNETSSSLDSRY